MKFRLDGLVQQEDRFWYDYDFGDGWEHEVAVELAHTSATRGLPMRCERGPRHRLPGDTDQKSTA